MKMIDEENDELTGLRQLKADAPANTLTRLRRRLGVLQLGRDLIERQAFAFWTILDAFLRIFLTRPSRERQGHAAAPDSESEPDTNNSPERKSDE